MYAVSLLAVLSPVLTNERSGQLPTQPQFAVDVHLRAIPQQEKGLTGLNTCSACRNDRPDSL
jgi:hypothetical protein